MPLLQASLPGSDMGHLMAVDTSFPKSAMFNYLPSLICRVFFIKKNLKNFMAPFYRWGSTVLRLEPLRGGSLLFGAVPRNFCYSFYQPQKDERPSQPWSHLVVLNTGTMDWKSSTLTTRVLPHKSRGDSFMHVHRIVHNLLCNDFLHSTLIQLFFIKVF